MQSSSSSRYRSGGFDDPSLTLPPIRDPGTYSSSQRSRYVTTMEPPAYPRTSVQLPSLMQPERSRTSMGYHTSQASTSPSTSRHQHPDVPSSMASYRHSSHHRSSSMSVESESFYHYSPQSSSSSHRSGSYASESSSPPTTRAFACDICGASFSRAYDCKRHRDIHTRQGGHECPYCHKSLSRADALKRHMERGCAGMDDEEDERMQRKDRRNSTGGDPHKYYSVNTLSRR